MPVKKVSSLKLSKKHKDQLRKWVAALRSGNYKQGKGRLRTSGENGKQDEFCCLGVWCDLRSKPKWELVEGIYYVGKLMQEAQIVPSDLFGGNPIFEDTMNGDVLIAGLVDGDQVFATVANDEKEWSFKKIATSIERYYQLKEELV